MPLKDGTVSKKTVDPPLFSPCPKFGDNDKNCEFALTFLSGVTSDFKRTLFNHPKQVTMSAIPGIGLLCLLLIFVPNLNAQTSKDTSILSLYPESIVQRSSYLTKKLDRKTQKMLSSLQRIETKMYKRLFKADSAAAVKIFESGAENYKELNRQLPVVVKGNYIAKLDTVITSLKFLQHNPELLKGSGNEQKINNALQEITNLQDKFKQTEEIQKFIKERRRQLREQFEKFGMVKQLKQYNKKIYYYSAQIKEYKEILKDSKKVERKALELLGKIKVFKDFFRKNSQLASLFRIPGDPSDLTGQANLTGLQTRAQVNSLIQQQIAAGGPGAGGQVSQNIRAAQAQLTQLKDKILKSGGSSSGDDMPDFKPNSQKTKSFWSRLEYGTNIQTQKATNFFPVTSDVGLSIGYKLNDKSIIGIGASYKMGWGKNWRDITISHQGIGARSYVDIKLKGSFWISAGYEQNYRSAFNSIEQLQNQDAWQQSGLLGVSKVISLKTKFFKKTKMQLLWDFLSYQQTPRVQPISFRIGYNF